MFLFCNSRWDSLGISQDSFFKSSKLKNTGDMVKRVKLNHFFINHVFPLQKSSSTLCMTHSTKKTVKSIKLETVIFSFSIQKKILNPFYSILIQFSRSIILHDRIDHTAQMLRVCHRSGCLRDGEMLVRVVNPPLRVSFSHVQLTSRTASGDSRAPQLGQELEYKLQTFSASNTIFINEVAIAAKSFHWCLATWSHGMAFFANWKKEDNDPTVWFLIRLRNLIHRFSLKNRCHQLYYWWFCWFDASKSHHMTHTSPTTHLHTCPG